MTYCSKCRTEERYIPTEQFARFTSVGEEKGGDRYDFCDACFGDYRSLRNRLISAQRSDNNGNLLAKDVFSPLLIDVDGEHVLTEDNYDFVYRWILVRKCKPNEAF